MSENVEDPLQLLKPAPAPKGYRKDTAELVAHVAGGPLTRDVLFLMPTGAIDRRNKVAIADTLDGELATLEAEVDAHVPSYGKAPYKIRLRDETGFLSVVYFSPRMEMVKRLWPVGQKRLFSGKVQTHGGERQMVHPDHVIDPASGDTLPPIEPVYPLTAGLSGRQVQRFVQESLRRLAELPEWQDAATLASNAWPTFTESLRTVHNPSEPDHLSPEAPWRTRLAFDEMFARQLALQLRRAGRGDEQGRSVTAQGVLRAKILASLPYAPTRAQARAVDEIVADMATPHPMLRLLQGDVGSGKTLVAALAMAQAADAGVQSALMAPTDILARQHAETILPLLAEAGIEAGILTGRDKAKERKAMLERTAEGAVSVLIGTHALFQDEVTFKDLGLVVIDEQHRFGVSDRLRLVAKGYAPHVLAMSATPIPRTLALAVHGDMDVSILDEKPPGRKPVRTAALPISRFDDVCYAVARASEKGERAYWVCPLIEESEQLDLAAAEYRYELLRERFGDAVELMHGRLSASDRDRVMGRFKSGEAFLMVATTVIEVGVNVPEATIMVIEHAERFGLAQLHQLRGRIGRGDKPGSCLLLWRPPLSETARERLDAMRRTEDGFAIAELDYKMRGGGDLLGVRQSGFPPFRFVTPEVHGELLTPADKEARLLLAKDPKLESPRGRASQYLLRLLGLDEARETSRSA